MNLSNLLGAVSMGALALAVAVVPSARAQEQLPVIDVGTALPTSGGGDVGQGFGDGAGTNNGTDIGPGNNGQICADGVCNNPTSYSAPIESLGTKVNTPVMDTPLATKMITHQMLEDQQVTTLDEALRNVSGVYISGGGGAALGVPFLGVDNPRLYDGRLLARRRPHRQFPGLLHWRQQHRIRQCAERRGSERAGGDPLRRGGARRHRQHQHETASGSSRLFDPAANRQLSILSHDARRHRTALREQGFALSVHRFLRE